MNLAVTADAWGVLGIKSLIGYPHVQEGRPVRYLSPDDACDVLLQHAGTLGHYAGLDPTRPIPHLPGWSAADVVAHVVDGMHDSAAALGSTATAAEGDVLARLHQSAKDLVAAIRVRTPLADHAATVAVTAVAELLLHEWDISAAQGRPTDRVWDDAFDNPAVAEVIELIMIEHISAHGRRRPELARLGGRVRFCVCLERNWPDDTRWDLTEGPTPDTIVAARTADEVPIDERHRTVTETHLGLSQLLLWLTRRIPHSGLQDESWDDAADALLSRLLEFSDLSTAPPYCLRG